MTRKARLLKKLASLANEFDVMGETQVADTITMALEQAVKLAAYDPLLGESMVDALSGPRSPEQDQEAFVNRRMTRDHPSWVPPEPPLAPLLPRKRRERSPAEVKQLNIDVQNQINRMLEMAREGHMKNVPPAVRNDGVMDQASRDLLLRFAGAHGAVNSSSDGMSYNNWGGLLRNLAASEARIKAFVSQPTAAKTDFNAPGSIPQLGLGLDFSGPARTPRGPPTAPSVPAYPPAPPSENPRHPDFGFASSVRPPE